MRNNILNCDSMDKKIILKYYFNTIYRRNITLPDQIENIVFKKKTKFNKMYVSKRFFGRITYV